MSSQSDKIQTAIRQIQNGRRVDAVLIYEEIAKQEAISSAVNIDLGHLCLELDNASKAADHFQAAVDEFPENSQYLALLGVALQRAGRADEALDVFDRAMAEDGKNPVVLHGMAIIYMDRSDFVQAKTLLAAAEQLKSSDVGIRTALATTLARLNEHELALKHAEKALKLSPDNPTAHYALANTLAEMGRVDEAVKQLEKTIRRHKAFGGAYDLLARMKKFTTADQAFIDKTERILKQGMPAQERLCLHYALGKMYDDCQKWDMAFEHFAQANLLQKKDYDLKKDRKLFKQAKKLVGASTLQKFREAGNPSTVPVFVVGMPRSGTTLIERMIAGDERAAGAGELSELPRIANAIADSGLTEKNISQYAEQYLAVLQQSGPNAERIVDKLPGNYTNLWLIPILFPNATIIHAIRHPLDTCLSCYFQNFAKVGWANEFSTIAEVYGLYRETLQYWKKVLPDGKIFDVVYEQLVQEPEVHGKTLLESCGLEWHSDSLEFYKKDKIVKTASLWQVRQPIYKSSRMRWKNYAAHIAELANGLSSYLQDDRQELADEGISLGRKPFPWLR